ncbi:MAG: hypothetical protein K0U98_12075 [Deltaproteobacteria bacterium]|nr:hypothetical protein [Deltaproteobacteria bacterium]
MKDPRRHLVWVDGLAGLLVGATMLLLRGWLSEWYGLPAGLLLLLGLANLAYGSYSTSLAARSHRPERLILLLVVANSLWAIFCLTLTIRFFDTATVLGLGQLLGEASFVGGLACLEWRWRDLLRTA